MEKLLSDLASPETIESIIGKEDTLEEILQIKKHILKSIDFDVVQYTKSDIEKKFFENLSNWYEILWEKFYELDHDKICTIYYKALELLLWDQRPETPDILEKKEVMQNIFKNEINGWDKSIYFKFIKKVEEFIIEVEKEVKYELNEVLADKMMNPDKKKV